MNNLNCFLTLELLSAQPMVQPLYAVEAGNTILLIKKSRNFENERYEHQLEKEASSECGQRKLQKVKSESERVGERPLLYRSRDQVDAHGRRPRARPVLSWWSLRSPVAQSPVGCMAAVV